MDGGGGIDVERWDISAIDMSEQRWSSQVVRKVQTKRGRKQKTTARWLLWTTRTAPGHSSSSAEPFFDRACSGCTRLTGASGGNQ